MKKYTLLSRLIVTLSVFVLAGNAYTQNGKGDAECYVTVKASKQGAFKFNSDNGGKGAACSSVSFRISSPRDAASGLPSGKRQHEPLMITKESDKASAQFFNALVMNETLNQVTIQSLSNGGKDKETITLTNATVSNFKHYTKAEGTSLQELDDISFTYQKISIAESDGITALDDWTAQ